MFFMHNEVKAGILEWDMKHSSSMRFVYCLIVLVGLITIDAVEAQSSDGSPTPAAALDVLLQDYAYRAFVRPRTGVSYDARVPSNLTGIKISAMRLRSGSLRNRGVRSYKEFHIPKGVIVQPYVPRLVFVYQNLGNWSSLYYPLPGYTYLTPVLGLLTYNAANLSGTGLPELDFVASGSPILINFTNVIPVPDGFDARCVWFDLDGLPEFRDLVSRGVCSTYRQGHFSIVVNSTGLALAPAPLPSGLPSTPSSPSKSHKSKVWKIVGGVIGGLVGLGVLVLLLICMLWYCQNRNISAMERRADAGEALRTARVGNTQAPVASGTRTQPVLENEYVA